MYGSVLILAKKKAAGPGGYFDPMMGHPGMAQGPMMFEMAQEEEEDTEEVPMSTEPVMKGSMEKDVRDIIADLRAAAQRLEDLHPPKGEKTEESEDEGEEEEEEEEEPEEAPAPKAKKPFPGFGPKKEMKY